MALGWDIYVRRLALKNTLLADESFEELSKGPLIATWDVGLHGLDWIDEYERRHEAIRVCGNGYPLSFLLSVAALRPILLAGPPGLATARDWHPGDRFDRLLLESLSGNELVYLEAWDKS